MAVLSPILLDDDDDDQLPQPDPAPVPGLLADAVLVAGNGQQGLDLLHTHCTPPAAPTCPALVLLDMKMPVMDGLQFLEADAQRPRPKTPPWLSLCSLPPSTPWTWAGCSACPSPAVSFPYK